MLAKTISAVCAAILFSSCATSRKATEQVNVFSSPTGADVTLSTGETAVTPASFVKSTRDNFQVTVGKPGFVAQTVTVQSSDGGQSSVRALYPNPVIVQLAALPTDPRRRGRTPPPGGYPVGLPSDQTGMVRSPYTHRLYNVQAVPHGALIHDLDVDDLFRNP